MTSMVNYLATAQRWREQWGYTGCGGVVVLHDGKVQSRVKELRTPNDWQPGCVAVDEDGKGCITIADTAEDGALMWLPIDPIAAKSGAALLRVFIESRLCHLVADQQRCEVEWRGAFWSKLPVAADRLSDIALMDQYEHFISLKILRDSRN